MALTRELSKFNIRTGEPVEHWCPACEDVEVYSEYMVCQSCIDSNEDDWRTPEMWAQLQTMIACMQAIDATRLAMLAGARGTVN